jgi:lipopolysaccharide export system protein LptA
MGGSKPANPPPPDAKAERTNLQITTIGPFTYDVLPDGDHARFDQLPPSATPLPNSVRVVRPQKRGANSVVNDQLECDHLELKFASKALPNIVGDPQPKAAPPKSKTDPDKPQIEWIHAWGQYVVLTSDEEKLEARGTELFHDAIAKTTTLTGVPETVALKDGNEIHAPKLVIYSPDDKTSQHAEAVGAGYFRMLDRTGSQRTVYARWKDHLDYRKEENRDLLTLVGNAMFEDKAGGQTLTADTLKLLLTPDNKNGPKVQAANAPPPRPKPQRLEGYGHVTVLTPDLKGRDIEELIVYFQDVAPQAVPGTTPPNGAQPPTGAPQTSPSGAAPATPNSQPGSLKPSDPTKPKNPIDLRARRVQAFLLTGPGDQTELDHVDCEGDVHVHQAPAPPQTKPIDMAGTGLVLRRTAEGNILEVKGPLNAPGRVTLPELELIGPFIKIDQVENSADVQGIGSMRIESQTDMQGKKLDKPVPLTVFWKQKMHFNGQVALFHGHVQADQADTSLLCNNMQVFLNKPVSLSQQTAQSQPQNSSAANVDKVICDNQGQELPQPVTITESIRGPDGKLQKYQRLETNTVAMHKEEGTMEAGEGNVRILQQGTTDTLSPTPPPKPGAKPAANRKPDDEFKLTWVTYEGSLRIDNPQRTARFYKNVQVLHLPMNDPGLQLEFRKLADHLPAGAMYLKCDRLDVYSTKDQNGKTNQEFTAKDRAEVQAQEFFGRANVIKFDEGKQTIIFEGSNGSLAELYRQKERGSEPDAYKAEKITYNRQTGAIKTDGTRMMNTGGGLKK